MRKIQFTIIALLGALTVITSVTLALVLTTQTFPVINIIIVGGHTNIYGDPPQIARPYKEYANTGFTATGATNNTNAVNEQTPDCSGIYCSYSAGGPGSSITFNFSALQMPAIYDSDTQAFNQTVWTTAILNGPSTSKQLRGTINLCSTGTQLGTLAILLPKTYTTFFVRVGANLTGYLDDICVTYIPFLLAAGDTIRIGWVQFMIPPTTHTVTSQSDLGLFFFILVLILSAASIVIIVIIRGGKRNGRAR